MSEWIRIGDRLPENAQRVIACCTNGSVSWMVLAYHYKGEWINTETGRFIGQNGIYESITHWMPLPDLPEEE